MKIVFIGSRSLDSIGGVENYMKNLCPRLVQMGYEVILYVEGEKYAKSIYEGVEVVHLPSIKNKFLNKFILVLLSTFHSIIFNRNVSIYHYNGIAFGIFSVVPRLLGKKVVCQGHGFEWQRAKWSNLSKRIILLMERFAILINKNFTMVSDEQTQYMKKFKKNCTTITPGVNILNKQFDSDIFNKFNIEKNMYILYLGRLVPEKKADVLIHAFNQLKVDDVKLVIAGDDPNEKKYIAYLKTVSKGNKNIIFTGAVYGDDKEALLQNCKVFCIPSELEGLPIVLLEAMSYGKICIASDIHANKEALGNAGIYFESNNQQELTKKILEVITNEDMCAPLGELAKERIKENFTWDQIALQFDHYYKKVIQGR